MGSDIKVKGTPEAIAVDANGNVYVTDYDLGRMQVFDNNGEFLWAWGDGNFANAPFKRPVGIAFDANGRIYITNQSGGNVLVFNLP
jgi:DNA-binding beta-propeller fold protein YncE